MNRNIIVFFAMMLLTFPGCSQLLGDPVRLVFQVEYEGDWSGIIVATDYYGSDHDLTEPKDGTEGIAITGFGEDEYSYVIDNNWYYIEAQKDDLEEDGNGELIPNTNTLTVRMIKYNPSEDTRSILREVFTTDDEYFVNTHLAIIE